jgi:hypothetical protein
LAGIPAALAVPRTGACAPAPTTVNGIWYVSSVAAYPATDVLDGHARITDDGAFVRD